MPRKDGLVMLTSESILLQKSDAGETSWIRTDTELILKNIKDK
jgi:hypothetical protein